MDGLAVPLRGVQLTLLGPENIEDYYCRGLMIDFANKKIGGGVLRNGCVQ